MLEFSIGREKLFIGVSLLSIAFITRRSLIFHLFSGRKIRLFSIKKIFSILLLAIALVTSAVFVAGCSDDKGTSSSSSKAT